jgi:hypothetical protein
VSQGQVLGISGLTGLTGPREHLHYFRDYLECRILAHGFARAHGEDCGDERRVDCSP